MPRHATLFIGIDPARTAHVVSTAERLHGAGAAGRDLMAREIVPNINRISAALRGRRSCRLFSTIDANAKTARSNRFQRMSGDTRADRIDEGLWRRKPRPFAVARS
jgi:hypothetical protein